MISNLLQNLIGLIDTRFMGMLSVDDSTPLAAVGVGALYFFVLTMIPGGFSTGTQIIAARRAGEMKHQEIGKLVDNSLLFMTLIGIVLFFLIKFLTPLILPFAFDSVPVQEQCAKYLNWRSYEFLVTGILMTMVAFQSGIGRTKSVMAAAIVMTGANLFFNYAFVFGKWGFPAMEIGGAGLASAISTALGALVMV
ncbi:MAG: Na+-driven multidrug efflux pump, partial [Limisphaerales bacterium]